MGTEVQGEGVEVETKSNRGPKAIPEELAGGIVFHLEQPVLGDYMATLMDSSGKVVATRHLDASWVSQAHKAEWVALAYNMIAEWEVKVEDGAA